MVSEPDYHRFGNVVGLEVVCNKAFCWPQEGADVWEVAVIYSARWVTYFIIWGIVTPRHILVMWTNQFWFLKIDKQL